MEVFWAKGFSDASVRDLLDGMGINRGSMYDTFGDKRALFLAAIEHYRHEVAGPLVEGLMAPGSPLENIRQTLGGLAEAAGTKDCRGCLITNVTVEIAPHDPEVAKAMKSALMHTEAALRKTLDRAVEEGEIAAKAETRALARFLLNTMQGLVVLGKAKLGKKTSNDIIDVAMAALTA
jgi:TetR/AcrR family transcriptional repressor of nem operon